MADTPTDITTEVIRNLPAIIGAITGLLTAVGIILIGYWTYQGNKKREENAAVLAAQTATLNGVAKQVDGMTSELVSATAGQKLAEGQLMERDAERAHLSETPVATEADPLKVKLVKGKDE